MDCLRKRRSYRDLKDAVENRRQTPSENGVLRRCVVCFKDDKTLQLYSFLMYDNLLTHSVIDFWKLVANSPVLCLYIFHTKAYRVICLLTFHIRQFTCTFFWGILKSIQRNLRNTLLLSLLLLPLHLFHFKESVPKPVPVSISVLKPFFPLTGLIFCSWFR